MESDVSHMPNRTVMKIISVWPWINAYVNDMSIAPPHCSHGALHSFMSECTVSLGSIFKLLKFVALLMP